MQLSCDETADHIGNPAPNLEIRIPKLETNSKFEFSKPKKKMKSITP